MRLFFSSFVLFCFFLSLTRVCWSGLLRFAERPLGALSILNEGASKSKDKGWKGLSCWQRGGLSWLSLWPLTSSAHLRCVSISSLPLWVFSGITHVQMPTDTYRWQQPSETADQSRISPLHAFLAALGLVRMGGGCPPLCKASKRRCPCTCLNICYSK